MEKIINYISRGQGLGIKFLLLFSLFVAVFYAVAAFVSLPFGVWMIGYPITAVFAIFAAVFMKKNELD